MPDCSYLKSRCIFTFGTSAHLVGVSVLDCDLLLMGKSIEFLQMPVPPLLSDAVELQAAPQAAICPLWVG